MTSEYVHNRTLSGRCWCFDCQDFVTLRRRFDRPLAEHRRSLEQIDRWILNHETKIRLHEEKRVQLTDEKERIEKDLDTTYQLIRSSQFSNAAIRTVSLPHSSFLRLRHWRKGPKTLKIFFQALACLFSVPDKHFLTELKVNPTVILHSPSPDGLDVFRTKFLHLKEISPAFVRDKSVDAHLIAVWMSQIEENDRVRRAQVEHDQQQQQWQAKIVDDNKKLSSRKQEIELIEHKLASLKQALHRQAFGGSN